VIYNEDNFPELPRGWASLTVDNSVESAGNSNKKLKSKDALDHGRFPVIDQGQSDISGYSDDESLVVDASESSPVILFGDHTRLLKQISQPFVPGADGTKLFRAKSFWDTRFVYQMLRAIKLPDKGYARHFQYLRDSVLPLPPLNEQKRIADKLDAVLARVDACRDRLDRIPAILKRFRQSVLAAATSGKLTEDWRDKNGKSTKSWLLTIPDVGVPLPDNYNRLGKIAFKLTKIEHSAGELPNTWSLLTIADLYKSNTLIDFADGNHGGMYPRKEDFTGEGAIFLTATQIGENWEIDIHACPRLRNDKAQQLIKGWAKKNDVLLTHNATVGRVALLEYGEEDVLLGTSVTFYRFNDKFISPNFARILFSSPFFQGQLKTEMAQTTRNQVPITKQVSLNFICPPIAEQTEIVRRVEALFAYSDRLEARYNAARAQVEKLTPSTLAKAFRGELVLQDPNDEPASVLLARIRAERAAEVGAGKLKRHKVSAKVERKFNAEVIMLELSKINSDHLYAILKDKGRLAPKVLWQASQLSIEDFYEQLRAEEAKRLLREIREGNDSYLEAA